MSTILMFALGSGLMAVGLLILAILWKTRAFLHSSPRRVSEEADAGVPSRPNGAPKVAELLGSENAGNNSPNAGVMSVVDELAKKIIIEMARAANEEARRAADVVEAGRHNPIAIVAEAERQAQQILKNAAGRAQDTIKAVRMTTYRVRDETGSALTNINNLLPASDDPADGSNDKLGVGNGHTTVLASVSTVRQRNHTMKRSVDDTEQGKENPAERVQTIEAERIPAVNRRLDGAATLAGRELVTSQTLEVGHFQEKEAGQSESWGPKKQGWSWRDLLWSYSRD